MELLAPAGTYNCLTAAVRSGADAVYFAGKGFGARSFAGNLSDDEIYRAADYCHLRGVRTYVTVNTLVFDREYKELERFVKVITRAGVDGVIVQDLGVLSFIRQMSPDIELHASTQMTVHSADGVRRLQKLGVSRVVLSRELSGEEIREIIKNTTAETEVFVHGAMCMSYSGQCLMSSIIGGRSGNRGKCAQPCRLPYSADGKSAKFYLSLKDMSYAEHIVSMADMGVASLKIEGRMKGEAYVSAVVSAYRRLIDERRKPTKQETDRLSRVFFRGGLTDGYYTGSCGKNMFAFDKPDNPYLKNDEDKIMLTERQIPAKISAEFAEGEVPKLKIECGEYTAEATGDFNIQTAANRPATEESIAAQLVKTGGTAFKITDTDIKVSGNPFVPVSALNELRRCAVETLETEILKEYKNKRLCEPEKVKKAERSGGFKYTCSVMSIEQYRAVCGYDFERIYVPLNIAEKFADELLAGKDRIVISLPVILRGEQREKCKSVLQKLKEVGFDKAEVSTIDAIPLADGFKLYASQRMNITNSRAAAELTQVGVSGICLSAELNLGQIRDIEKYTDTEVIAYGRIPIMISENCMLKNMDKCPCDGYGEICDRTGAVFPVVRDGDICRSVVLNSVPLYMGDKRDDLKKINTDLRLMLTTETAEQCKAVCEDYILGKSADINNFTRLHLYKGALD